MFWISADAPNTGATKLTPRTTVQGDIAIFEVSLEASTCGYFSGESKWHGTDAVVNGVATLGPMTGDPNNQGEPRLVSLTPPYDYLGFSTLVHGTALIESIYWIDEQPMLLEPLFGWGDTPTDPLLVRCQFYDAWIQTKQYTPTQDTVRNSLNNQLLQPFEMFGQVGYWLPFTFACKWGTIVLLVPTPEPDTIVSEDLQYCY